MILDAYPDLNNNTIRWLGLTLYLHNIAIDISLPAWNQQHLWTLSTLMETSNPPLLRSGCGRNVFSWNEIWNRMWWTFEYIKRHSAHAGSNSNFQCRSYICIWYYSTNSQHWGPPISWVTWTSTLMEVFGHHPRLIFWGQHRGREGDIVIMFPRWMAAWVLG